MRDCRPLWKIDFYVDKDRVRALVRSTIELAAQQGAAPAELAQRVTAALFLMIDDGPQISEEAGPAEVAVHYLERAAREAPAGAPTADAAAPAARVEAGQIWAQGDLCEVLALDPPGAHVRFLMGAHQGQEVRFTLRSFLDWTRLPESAAAALRMERPRCLQRAEARAREIGCREEDLTGLSCRVEGCAYPDGRCARAASTPTEGR